MQSTIINAYHTMRTLLGVGGISVDSMINRTVSSDWYVCVYVCIHPISQLVSHLNLIWQQSGALFTAATPFDSYCVLIAFDNVLGRLINGTPLAQLCTTDARVN
jgi:hypothetical protein